MSNQPYRRTHRIISIALAMTFLAAAFSLTVARAGGNSKKINVGVQLYSLRVQFPKYVAGTMALINSMGVDDVECAGVYNLSPDQFRKELDAHHLRASGGHFQWDDWMKDTDGVIKSAKALGCEYVTVPWVPHTGDEFTIENAHTAAKMFNEWGKKAAAAGLKFCYHPHGYEFRPYEGGTLFDVIAKETDPKFANFEIDIFWAFDGGADPVKLMEKYPDRFVLMHLKDMKKGVKTPNYTGHEDTESDVGLGTGQLDIPAIVKEGVKIGIKHYYIEDESKSSEKQIPQSIQYIRSIGF
ncbi:MAG TPA: sugar phosphate isomerase/epimerase [Humisphaera sp.]|nr:sugar phosphate isomerase/epimerase [Humisphaera sp.]